MLPTIDVGGANLDALVLNKSHQEIAIFGVLAQKIVGKYGCLKQECLVLSLETAIEILLNDERAAF
jgi:hypothetical protein